MNVWLIKTGEPLPVLDGVQSRLFRTGLMAKAFHDAGHSVTWWVSNFSHQQKRRLAQGNEHVLLRDGLELRLLHGIKYKKNFSIRRFINHWQLAKDFERTASGLPRPDVIISSYPNIELCNAAIRYGKERGVPVFIDLRDMWPDIFPYHVSPWLRPIMRFALRGMFLESERIMRSADGLIGITQEFLDWGLKRARRSVGSKDMVLHLAYPDSQDTTDASCYRRMMCDLGIPDDGVFTICFIGTLGLMFDFETVIRGCEILKSMGRKYRLLVCGKGERLEEYKRACSGNESIRFLGWLTATQLGAVLSISHVGLNPMPERFDFIASINNKAAEYMCGGVPILMTPARGALFDLLNRESIGLAYPSGDAQGFAEMIVRMQDHSQERLRMAENARKLFKRSFWDAVVYKEFVNRMASIV